MGLSTAALLGIHGGMALANNVANNWMQGSDINTQNQFNLNAAQQQAQWNMQMQNQLFNQSVEQWNRQNAYNHPAAQMARFKEAGLNPHLIYGQGNAGNAANMSVPDVKPYSRAEAANTVRGLDVFGEFNRFGQIHAQTNNLEANTDLARQNAILTAQKTASEAIATAKGRFDYDLARELKETSVEAARANLEKLQTENKHFFL